MSNPNEPVASGPANNPRKVLVLQNFWAGTNKSNGGNGNVHFLRGEVLEGPRLKHCLEGASLEELLDKKLAKKASDEEIRLFRDEEAMRKKIKEEEILKEAEAIKAKRAKIDGQ